MNDLGKTLARRDDVAQITTVFDGFDLIAVLVAADRASLITSILDEIALASGVRSTETFDSVQHSSTPTPGLGSYGGSFVRPADVGWRPRQRCSGIGGEASIAASMRFWPLQNNDAYRQIGRDRDGYRDRWIIKKLRPVPV